MNIKAMNIIKYYDKNGELPGAVDQYIDQKGYLDESFLRHFALIVTKNMSIYGHRIFCWI